MVNGCFLRLAFRSSRTTGNCGTYNMGTVWKVSKRGRETILHSFAGATSDGASPLASVSLDREGNMYGTTQLGGSGSCHKGCGTVYKLNKSGTLTLLHSFEFQTVTARFPRPGSGSMRRAPCMVPPMTAAATTTVRCGRSFPNAATD